MNKKLLKSTLAVAMVAVAGYGSYEAYERYAKCRYFDNLLLENIDALSKDEDDNNSGCPGLAMFAASYKTVGEFTTRVHYTELVDVVTDYSVTYCQADGIGEKKGFQGPWNPIPGIRRYELCKGEQYHYNGPL